ncbi:MAG: DUF6624 domain-containing protein [Saprospiraceae bacterium]|nr:DUF6624 domain-containing protein [Saprospiraceae bacterium]
MRNSIYNPNIILFFLSALLAGPVLGQAYEKSKADSLRESGDLKLAIEEYHKLYLEDPDNNTNTYNYACALALDQQIDSAFHYVRIATAEDTSVQALNDPDFYFLIDDERWSELEDELVERVEAKYGEYPDLPLSKELWKMKIKDQAFYYHIRIANEKVGRESPLVSAIWELKRKLNDNNLKRIEEIIETHGWPKSSVVKGSAANAVFLVIQHADIETQKKYLPLMKEAANNGEASWSALALLIDRVNLREGRQQIYGSQIYMNEDGSYYVKDLKEPEYVNQRRKEVGLGPIQEYVQRWGIEWDIEQKEK